VSRPGSDEIAESAHAGLSDRPAEGLIERRQRLLGPAYRLFYSEPVHIVRGEGVWLYDVNGNAYLDAYNNVACVGHCHPHVLGALADQAATLNTHTRYLSELILDYASRLLATMPNDLGHVMFTCTGSEANDLAYRIARETTGATGFIVTEFAYHGVTVAISQLSPSLGDGVKLPATTCTIPAPDGRRPHGGDVTETFAASVRAAIGELSARGLRPAALLVDTIFSSDGIYPDPAGFLAPAAKVIHDAGGLFIADEVQPGFGRTGAGMWGFGRHGIVPDIVTMGKPMGAGHPIAGLIARPELLETFGRRTRYFNTFGGNPVSCAVGMAVLDVIEKDDLIENARSVGKYLVDGLRSLAKRHPEIDDVRGAGLFVGVEIVSNPETKEPDPIRTAALVNGLRQRRILISVSGPGANVLKIRPPLVFSCANVDQLLSELDVLLGQPG
jgi:4-aminobutyrate aminotransferase-like enzyme